MKEIDGLKYEHIMKSLETFNLHKEMKIYDIGGYTKHIIVG